ncbi:MAG: radical SAM protein [Candidatus Hodarchaeota archaeon]
MTQIDWVHIGVTGKCNFRCQYCYAAEDQQPDYKELTIPEFEQYVIPAVQNMKPNAIDLEGGEPLFEWERLTEMIKLIEANVSSVETLQMTTNGSLLTEKRIKKLRELTDKDWTIVISIDTLQEEKDVRNPRAYRTVRKNIELCEQYGLLGAISVVVTNQNFREIETILKKYKNSETLVLCFPIIPHNPEHKKFALDSEQLTTLDRLLLENFLNPAFFPSPMPLNPEVWGDVEPILKKSNYRQYLGCTALKYDIDIRPDGIVKPCQVFNLELGDLKSQTIKEILNTLLALKIKAYEKYEGKCGKCKYVHICLGGCRARAHMETGNFFGEVVTCEGGPDGHPLEEIATETFLDSISRLEWDQSS